MHDGLVRQHVRNVSERILAAWWAERNNAAD
jgi:hypothetical protein